MTIWSLEQVQQESELFLYQTITRQRLPKSKPTAWTINDVLVDAYGIPFYLFRSIIALKGYGSTKMIKGYRSIKTSLMVHAVGIFIKSKTQMLFIMFSFLNQINFNIWPPQPQKLPLNLSNLKKGPVQISKITYKKIIFGSILPLNGLVWKLDNRYGICGWADTFKSGSHCNFSGQKSPARRPLGFVFSIKNDWLTWLRFEPFEPLWRAPGSSDNHNTVSGVCK